MNGRRAMIALAVAACCVLAASVCAWGQTETPPPTADLKAAAEAPSGEPRSQLRAVPGDVQVFEAPDVILTKAEATVKVGDRVAEGHMQLQINSDTDQPRHVLVLPPSLAVTDATVKRGNKSGLQLVRRPDGYHLYCVGKGYYEYAIEFAMAVSLENLRKELELPLPGATTSLLTVTLPGTSLNVSISPELPLKVAEGRETTTVTVFGGRQEMLKLTWTPKAPEKLLEPKVFAEQQAVCRLGLGVLRVQSRINFTVVQGKVQSFRLPLWPKAVLLKVDGQNIRSWDVKTEGAQPVLVVELLGPVTDNYSLTLALEQPIETPAAGAQARYEIPVPEVLDVGRETGWVAITADRGLKAEADQVEGVSQIDVREMPPIETGGTAEMHLGFKYVKRPIRIAVRLGLVEAKVSGDVYSAVKISPESVRMTTTIDYQIKDAGVFQFRIRLDPGVRLADLEGSDINNWSLADRVLTVDLRAKAEGAYTLKLITEKQLEGQDVEVPRIELVDVQRERGFLALEASAGTKMETRLAEGITQMNIKDLPEKITDRQTATLAYRYIRHPYRLTVAISEVQPDIVASTRTFVALEETETRVTFDVDYEILKAGVFNLRLGVPAGLQVLSLEGPQVEDWKMDRQTNVLEVLLKAKTQGATSIHLAAEQRLDRQAQQPMPLPNITCIGVRRETGFLAVRPAEGLRARSAESALTNIREIDVKELPPQLQQAGVALAYKYFLQPWQAALQLEAVEPYVTAEVFNFLSLGEAYVQAAAAIQYSIQYAGAQTFRFKLPAGAVNVDVTAADLKSKEPDPAQANVWTITLQAKRKGTVMINVSYQTKLDKEARELAFVGVEALDVKHERGFVSVAPRSDLEVAATEKTTGVIPIDDREIPRVYMTGIGAPAALAFRYPARPYELRLSMTRREPADVLVALVEACRFVTTITDDGNMITDAVYRMRNIRKQYLELRLPAEAQIWHVFVDNDRVKPVISTDAQGRKVTMIPIVGHGREERPFEIRLRYSGLAPSLGWTGRLALDVPGAEVATLRVAWELAVPKDYVVVNSWGTLNRVEQFESDLAALALTPAAPPRIYNSSGQEASAQEKIQEEFNKRVMDHSDAAQPSQAPTPPPAGQPGTSGRPVTQPPAYATPQGISMNRYYFQTLVAVGEPPTLRVRYMLTPFCAVTRGVLSVLVAVVCLVFWLKMRGSPGWKFLATLSAAALVLAVRTMAAGSYEKHLTDVLWVLLAAAAVFGLGHLIRMIVLWLRCWYRNRPVATLAAAGTQGTSLPVKPTLVEPAQSDSALRGAPQSARQEEPPAPPATEQ